MPFREFVLKIHSRCDLACDYCYMYTMADQSWRGRPMVMSRATIEATAARIAEHALAHELPSVGVSLHGGEPLLAGPEFIVGAVSELRRAMPPHTQAKIDIQTNGVRLDERFLDLFKRLGVKVGVSVDGAAAAHDRHRRFAHGAGSNAAYAQGDMTAAEARYRAASALAEAAQDTPLVAHLLAAIGRTLLNRRRFSEAVDCLYGAVARLPNDQAVQAELGQALDLIELAG